MIVTPGAPEGAPKQSDVKGLNGFEGEMENAKQRTVNFLKNLGRKTYIDKISPEVAEKIGLGNVDYFTSDNAGKQLSQEEVERILQDVATRGGAEKLLSNAPDRNIYDALNGAPARTVYDMVA
jgi:hypothetical protein